MKKPILTFEQRTHMYSPELKVAWIKVKRAIDKAPFGIFMKQSIEILSKMLDAIQTKKI